MNNFTILDKCIGLIAKRNSGKSVLLKHLVNLMKLFSYIYYFVF